MTPTKSKIQSNEKNMNYMIPGKQIIKMNTIHQNVIL